MDDELVKGDSIKEFYTRFIVLFLTILFVINLFARLEAAKKLDKNEIIFISSYEY